MLFGIVEQQSDVLGILCQILSPLRSRILFYAHIDFWSGPGWRAVCVSRLEVSRRIVVTPRVLTALFVTSVMDLVSRLPRLVPGNFLENQNVFFLIGFKSGKPSTAGLVLSFFAIANSRPVA